MLSPAVVSPYVLAGDGSCKDERMIADPLTGLPVEEGSPCIASTLGFLLGVAGECDMVRCTEWSVSQSTRVTKSVQGVAFGTADGGKGSTGLAFEQTGLPEGDEILRGRRMTKSGIQLDRSSKNSEA